MAKRKTRIGYLMDESWSMHPHRDSVISSFAEYVKGMQGAKRTKLSAYSFTTTDDHVFLRLHTLYEKAKPSDVVLPVEYAPMASTPLYDAVGATIARMEKQVKDDKTDVLIVIHTDGLENASREHTQESIQRLIERKKQDGWNFQYVAEDMSVGAALRVGASMGISEDNVMNVGSHNRGQAAVAMASAHTTYTESSHTGPGRKTMSVKAMYEDAGEDKDANA